MSYSFIATAKTEPNWKDLNVEVLKPNSAIEIFPIESRESGEFCLGICIPYNKMDDQPDTWDHLIETINVLKKKYDFEIFDLYNGFFIDDKNIKTVKKSLIG